MQHTYSLCQGRVVIRDVQNALGIIYLPLLGSRFYVRQVEITEASFVNFPVIDISSFTISICQIRWITFTFGTCATSQMWMRYWRNHIDFVNSEKNEQITTDGEIVSINWVWTICDADIFIITEIALIFFVWYLVLPHSKDSLDFSYWKDSRRWLWNMAVQCTSTKRIIWEES